MSPNLRLLAIAVLACSSLSGCRLDDKPPATKVVALIDVVTASADATVRQRYLDDWRRYLAGHDFTSGAVILAEEITENTAATSSWPVHEVVARRTMLHNTIDWKTTARAAAQRAEAGVAKLLATSPANPGLDVISALRIAGRTIAQTARTTHTELVVFSSMLHRTATLDLSTVSPGQDDELIAALRAQGDVADLTGVRVRVAGAAVDATLTVSAAQAAVCETFWRRYFQAAGADLRSYDSRLLTP